MNKAIRVSTCVLAALTLSGCQGFLHSFAFNKKAERVEAPAAVFGQEELEQGRLALKSGHPARAIQQFRMAALNQETAPDAFNGLGVAYAKLGRADLAERYFKAAVTMDSSNPKFAANLDKFYRSPLGTSAMALAMRQKEAAAQLAAAEKAAKEQGLLEQEVAVERRGAVTLEKPAVTLARTSNRELRIATRSPGAEAGDRQTLPTVAIRNPTPAKDEEAIEQAADTAEDKPAKKAAPPRISMLGMTASSDSYPVRIRLAKPDSSGAKQLRSRSYPVRIPLGRTVSGE